MERRLNELSRSNNLNQLSNAGGEGNSIARNGGTHERINFKLKVDTYDGTGRLKEYLEQFELVAQAYNWTNGEKVMVLATNLRGKACSVLEAKEKVSSLTFEGLSEKLQQRYGEKLEARTYSTLFFNRRQKFNETISVFGTEIERLAELAYPDCPFEVCKIIACDRFISGLNNNFVKQMLLVEGQTSLKEAIERAEGLGQLEVGKMGKPEGESVGRNFKGRKDFEKKNEGKEKIRRETRLINLIREKKNAGSVGRRNISARNAHLCLKRETRPRRAFRNKLGKSG